MTTLVTGLGLNPMRTLRIAAALDPARVLVITSPETQHLVSELEAAARWLGWRATFTQVPGDAYRFDLTLAEVESHAVLRQSLGERLVWVIGGGTKPLLAAQAVAAAQLGGEVWYLDDRSRVLVSADRRIPLPEPTANLTPRLVVRMHAGLHAAEDPDQRLDAAPGQACARISWLAERVSRASHRDINESKRLVARRAELAIVELVRACLPADHAVHPSQTVTLRHPLIPEKPATYTQAGRMHLRRFEIDGLVIRGTQVWCIESKFANLGLKQARVAAAELDQRRRHFGGDTANGVLVMLSEDVSRRFPVDLPDFLFGGVRVVGREIIAQAADAVLAGRPTRETKLARVFLGP